MTVEHLEEGRQREGFQEKGFIEWCKMRIRFSFRGLSSLPYPPPKWRITGKIFTTQLSLLQDGSLTFRFFSSSPTSRSANPKQCYFTVSYLINSCGLSPDSALSASQKLHLVTPERPDSILSLLRNYGITDTQLPKLIRVFPTLLLTDPEKTLLPKLEFLNSKPFSRADLGRVLSSCPMILSRSLDNQIIPCYNFFKSILHLDNRVVSAIKRSPRIFLEDVNKNIVPNITALQEIGVPESSIVFLITYYPIVVQLKHDRFAFPACMSLSEKKIMSTMDFLVNKMGWKLTEITRFPISLGFNLEKRIIPRCWVGKVLMLKGLVKKDLSLGAFLRYTESKFLDRFVIKYQNHIPQLLNLYKGEVGMWETGRELKHSFTVSYLVNSCGLSPETAISASEKIHFENPKNPDSVLALLRNSGCTNTHITKIVTKLPSLLLVDPEKTLLPKLEFFCSMGFSSARVASMLSPDPSLLGRSLEKVLIPKYNFLKSVHISNEDAIKVLRRSSWSSSGNLERNIAANIAVLRETGVPISRISYLVTRYHAISLRSDKFSENVKKVVEMGFNPLKFTFLDALQAFCQTTESTRQQKMEMYRRWGWSEDEILSAFRRRPQCMQLSEKKVNKVLDFLMYRRWGWSEDEIVSAFRSRPQCMQLSEKKVTKVLDFLMYRGWGWSEDEILLAFRTCPQCMQLSENKVTKVLDFLVNKMGWQPAVVARAPIALCLNFEKRVVPRCSVVKVLLLKGLVKKDLKLGHFLSVTEGDFVDKYVIKNLDDIPQLLDLYQGKVSFIELEFGS
ncbi:unnamed protein product, partial [Vitis vinifera]